MAGFHGRDELGLYKRYKKTGLFSPVNTNNNFYTIP